MFEKLMKESRSRAVPPYLRRSRGRGVTTQGRGGGGGGGGVACLAHVPQIRYHGAWSHLTRTLGRF